MAFVTNWTCRVCHKAQHSAEPRNYTCHSCEKEKRDRERREHFGALDACTIEERLRKIEEWQYEHSKKYHPGREMRF